MLLQKSRRYVLCRLGNRYVKRTYSLFLDDLICIINLYDFLYKDIQNYLKFVNEAILQASHHINNKVISVDGYHMMNFCIFHNIEKDQLYQKMMRKLLNQENLYMKRNRGRRGLKPQIQNYRKNKVCLACQIKMAKSKRIKIVWK